MNCAVRVRKCPFSPLSLQNAAVHGSLSTPLLCGYHQAKHHLGPGTCVFGTDRKTYYTNIKQQVNIINYSNINPSFQCKQCSVIAMQSCKYLVLFLTADILFLEGGPEISLKQVCRDE